MRRLVVDEKIIQSRDETNKTHGKPDVNTPIQSLLSTVVVIVKEVQGRIEAWQCQPQNLLNSVDNVIG
jgi:hypothetical protein